MIESKKRRTGRTGPRPLPAEEKRDKRLSISMRAADYEKLARAAGLAHRDVAVYVRDLCLGTAIRIVPPVNVKAWQRLCKELEFLHLIAEFVNKQPVLGEADSRRVVGSAKQMLQRLQAALLGVKLELDADRIAFDGVEFDEQSAGARDA